MTFADPRPFHLDKDINPWMCYATFGNPGDHALAGMLGVIVIFLDMFHGTPIKFNYENDSIFHAGWLHCVAVLFSLYWIISMPYARYLAGVQSADQLIFGAALGFLLGIFCHFVVRDHLIGFFEKIIHWQNESKGLLERNKERSDEVTPEGDEGEKMYDEQGLDEVHKCTLSGQAEDKDAEFHPCKFLLVCMAIWVCAIGMGTAAFIVWGFQLQEASADMIVYKGNLGHHGCGEFKFAEVFQNKMFPNVGRITFHIASMMIFTQRKRIGCQLCYNYKLQDGTNLSSNKKIRFYQVCARIIIFALMFGVYVTADMSGHGLKVRDSVSVGNRYVVMFTTVIYPLLIIAYLLNAGVYDLFVMAMQKCCIKGPKADTDFD